MRPLIKIVLVPHWSELTDTILNKVSTWGGISVILAVDSFNGTFCCGHDGYNVTSQKCVQSTLGSDEPFSIPFGNIIYNTTSGSIVPNITSSTETTNVVTTQVSNSQSKATEIAIGAGIGIPLTVALVVVSILLSRQIALRRELETQLQQASSHSNHTFHPSKPELSAAQTAQLQPTSESGGQSLYELHGGNYVPR